MTLLKLMVRFYRTEQGNEPVREWLKDLPVVDRKTVGDEIRAVQFGWPVGMPLVRKVRRELWEVRVRLDGRTARVFFTMFDGEAVLLHGFIKKSRQTPVADLRTAVERMTRLHAVEKRATR
jgi:phage-related protein